MSGVYVSGKFQPVTSSKSPARGINEAQPPLGHQAGRRFILTTMLAAAFCATLALNLPGHLSYDSVNQLMEGRNGHYSGWHPPVMSWLIGLTDALIPGTGLYIFLQCALFFAALSGLLLLPRRIALLGIGALAGCLCLPQIILYQSIVWKDVLFADAALAGFVCLATAAKYWRSTVLRWTLLISASLLLVLASLVRQNGAIILPFAAICIFWMVKTEKGNWRWRAPSLYAGGFLAVSSVAIVLAGTALETRIANGSAGTRVQLRLLETYDLIGAAASDPALQFDILRRNAPALDTAIRSDGVKFYLPRSSDSLQASPALLSAIAGTNVSVVSRQWRDLIWNHFALYLALRARVFEWASITPKIDQCVPFIVGVQGQPDTLRTLGLSRRTDSRDRALLRYVGTFLHTPLFSHLTFALLSLGLMGAFLIRRRPEDIAIASMLASAIAFALSFFVISIACDYRYLYYLDLSAITGLIYFCLDSSLAKGKGTSAIKQ